MLAMATLLRLAYDGTAFHGFARQHNPSDPSRSIRTVQGELEAALGKLYKQPLRTRGASRTDAGVHARGRSSALTRPSRSPRGACCSGSPACCLVI